MTDGDISEPVELAGEWPAGAPSGVFITSRRDGGLWIDHADPRVMISAELVEAFASGPPSAFASITGLDYTRPGGHVGALFKLHGTNRQVVYRLTKWEPSIRAYLGEWPE